MAIFDSMDATPASPLKPQPQGPGVCQLIIVVVILVVGLVLTTLTADVTRGGEPGIRLINEHPFLPETAGVWKGSAQSGLTEDERAVLPPDTEKAARIYTNANGQAVFCSIVLAGRDVTSIHRPEVCLTGQGWKLNPAQTERIETPAAPGGVLRVSRMNASNTMQLKNEHSAQVYAVFAYWFIGHARTTPYHWQRIWWTTLDRIFHNRNHRWAYFLLDSIVSPERAATDPQAGQEESMQLLRQFIQGVYPQLTAN